MRKERIRDGILIIAIIVAVGMTATGTVMRSLDKADQKRQESTLKHQVTELALREQEQGNQLSELMDSSMIYKKQITTSVTSMQMSLDNAKEELDSLRKSVEELTTKVAELSKKAKPVTIASASRNGATGARLSGFEVTWYNTSGTTASGRTTRDGVTVSVDPKLIPLGTWLKLTFPDGTQLIRRADDTGGRVKGHVLDVYASASRKELLQRGRTHNVTVELLDGEPTSGKEE
jgi:3D (Asp-Asp-Asp) domain-containing protein